MNGSDLHTGDKVKLTGTGTEAVVVAVKGNAVEVRTTRGATITTSVYQVVLVESAKPAAVKKPKRRRDG